MSFFLDNFIWIILSLVSGSALLWPMLHRGKHHVGVLQATQLMNQSKSLVLDVREPEFFQIGHLMDAENIPLKHLQARMKALEKFKNKQIIIVCQTGTQSGKAAIQMIHAGFAHTVCLDGGITAWQNQGLPVYK